MNLDYIKNKKTSANERFGASGGVGSTDTEQVTSSFALVRALPMPPPAAKPRGVICHFGTAQQKIEVKINNIRKIWL